MAVDPLWEEARRRAAAQTAPALTELQRQLEAARQRNTAQTASTRTGYEALAARAPQEEQRVNEIYGSSRRSAADAYNTLQNEISRLYGSEQGRQESNAARMGLSAAVTGESTDRGEFLRQLNNSRAANADSALNTLQTAYSQSARQQGDIYRMQGASAVDALARQLADFENQGAAKRAEISMQEAGTADDIYSSILRSQQDAEKEARRAAMDDIDMQLKLEQLMGKRNPDGSKTKYKGIQGAESLLRSLGYDDMQTQESVDLLQRIMQAHGSAGQERKLDEYLPDGRGGIRRNADFDRQADIRRRLAIINGSPINSGDRKRFGKDVDSAYKTWRADDLRKQLLTGTDDPEVLAQEVRHSAQRRGLNPQETKNLIDALYAMLGQYS